MILVDTSVWIDHIRLANLRLSALLSNQQVLTHPFVLGELALGAFVTQDVVIGQLAKLEAAPVMDSDEVMRLIVGRSLAGSGIGYVDAHLLASCLVSTDALLWTRDKRLHATAERLGVALSG